MERKVLFEGEQIPINDLSEGFYLVKLRSHNLYTGPRVSREEIIGFISGRNWQELDVEVSPADFPYAYLYEPQSRKDKTENLKQASPNTQLAGPGIPRIGRDISLKFGGK